MGHIHGPYMWNYILFMTHTSDFFLYLSFVFIMYKLQTITAFLVNNTVIKQIKSSTTFRYKTVFFYLYPAALFLKQLHLPLTTVAHVFHWS